MELTSAQREQGLPVEARTAALAAIAGYATLQRTAQQSADQQFRSALRVVLVEYSAILELAVLAVLVHRALARRKIVAVREVEARTRTVAVAAVQADLMALVALALVRAQQGVMVVAATAVARPERGKPAQRREQEATISVERVAARPTARTAWTVAAVQAISQREPMLDLVVLA